MFEHERLLLYFVELVMQLIISRSRATRMAKRAAAKLVPLLTPLDLLPLACLSGLPVACVAARIEVLGSPQRPGSISKTPILQQRG